MSKNLKIERILRCGYDETLKAYKYTAYTEKEFYRFLVIQESNNEPLKKTFRRIQHDTNYIIKADLQSVIGESYEYKRIVADEPDVAICEALEFDYEVFKNDLFVSVDKTHFFDYLKHGMNDYEIVLPLDNLFTPNTNWSHADTTLAVLDREHKSLDGDYEDFLRSVFDRLLSYDKSLIQPFLFELSEHLFSEFLTDDEQEELKKSGRSFLYKPDKFFRSFRSYSDHIDFKYSYKYDEDTDDGKSVAKFYFCIREGVYDGLSEQQISDTSLKLSSFFKQHSILGYTPEARKAYLDKKK